MILPSLDTATLAVARAVIQMTLAGLIIWTGYREGQRPGAPWWAWGLGLHGLALLVFTVRYPPLDGLITAFNHLGFGLSSALILIGFWRFADRPVQRSPIAIIVLIPAVSLLLWEVWMPNARFRILTTAAGQVVFLLALRIALRRAPRSEMEGIYRVLRWIVPAYTLLLIWAYASLAGLLPTTARVPPGYHGILFSVGSMLFMLSLAVSFLALQYADMACRQADQARRDGLTGLLNRRGFLEAIEEMKERGRTAGRWAVMAIDADHFKSVNDRHGHAMGDRVLEALAEDLKSIAVPGDLLARMGGEEFVLLRPDAGLSAIESLAEILRARVVSRSVEGPRGQVQITVSIGVAMRMGEETPEQTLNRADRVLYRAKRAGRNRVVVAH
jgi:diguanylate cyclase (GGDEF)-like protein